MCGGISRVVCLVGICTVLAAVNVPFASAGYIVNGDFESTAGWTTPPNAYPNVSTPPPGWEYRFVIPTGSYSAGSGCAVQETSNPLQGATSARIESFGDGTDHDWQGLYQSVGTATDPVPLKWRFDVDVSLTPSGSSRPMQFYLIYGDDGAGQSPSGGLSGINLRVTSAGGLDVYSSTNHWVNVFAAGSIDVDAMTHLGIVGDFDTTDATAVPFYSIGYDDGMGMVWSSAVSQWYGTAPTGLQSLVAVQLASNAQASAEYNAFTNSYVVDNVSLAGMTVPEPSSWHMLAFGLLGLLGRRRVSRRKQT